MNRKKWSSEKIFGKLLTNKSEEAYWDNIRELRLRPMKAVFEKALRFTNSKLIKERAIGVDILAQLGSNPRPFYQETITRYFELLNLKEETEVIVSLLCAIGHNNDNLTPAQIFKMVQFKNHKIGEVRQGLVTALLGVEHNNAIEVLIELSEDSIPSIRNWATFGIGTQIEVSNKKIIDALWRRTLDQDQITRLEAIVGLANRGENKVKELIIKELEAGEYGILLFDAMVSLNDKDFIPYLEKNLGSAKEEDSINEDWIQGLEACIEELKR